MSLRCFFAVARRHPEGSEQTPGPRPAPPPLPSPPLPSLPFAGLLQDNGANLVACWCYLTAVIKPPAVVRWAKAPDPDRKQPRVNKTLDCQVPLMNACIHNARGREINESVWFGGWNATGPDCLTVKDGCSRRCRTGPTSWPPPLFAPICEKRKAIGSGNLFKSAAVT